MARMTGGEAIVAMLQRHGVDTLFALPGVQNDALFNALHDAGNAIRVVHTRHEQGAAYMAYGYARSTGRVGAYAVVPGPGLLNTTAALATAYAGSAPVLCLAGQIPLAMIGRGIGFLHEIPDQLGILRSLTKWTARIEHSADAPRLVNEAFRELRSGRPRPVALEAPIDVLAHAAEVTLRDPLPPDPPPEPEGAAIEKAAALLAGAQRPLLYVGSGAVAAGEEVRRVAEMLGAPVVANYSGRGVLSDRHPLSFTSPAGYRLWPEVDVMLAVGTRAFPPQAQWGLDDAIRIVRIDIDPVELARVRAPAIGIVADARAGLAALAEALARQKRAAPSRDAELDRLREQVTADLKALSPQYEYVMALREALPEDGFLVDDLTQIGYAARIAFPVWRPRQLVTTAYQGTLGYGFAASLGVKLAHPDKAVVSISGDGGFLYNVQELATAVLHRIPVVAVVFNDNAYGNVKRMQEVDYGGRVIATELRNPDFPRLAETFGAVGARATTPEELTREIRAGLGRGAPTLIEVPVGRMPDPWPLIHRRRNRPAQRN